MMGERRSDEARERRREEKEQRASARYASPRPSASSSLCRSVAPSLPHPLRPCPVCGSIDDTRVFAESNVDESRLTEFAFASRKLPEYMHHRLIACPTCDLLYASPIPAMDHLAKEYEQAAFDSGPEAHYAARTYARILRTFIDRLPDRDGALDIGTGDGAFLEELQALRFTSITGVEPSSAPIAAAADSVKPFIRQGLFRSKDYGEGIFSLITCFQTIEHLSDPAAMCRSALKLLKPGGALFLIGHNRRALSAKLLGRKSPIFDVEHLQLFSKRSSCEMLSRAGFEGVRVRSFVNRYPVQYWMKLVPFPNAIKPKAIRIANAMRVGTLPLPMPAGNIAVVGFNPRV